MSSKYLNDRQSKKDYKNRVSSLIQQYEHNNIQKEAQKQEMKKQIMLQIMSNRQKNQITTNISSSTQRIAKSDSDQQAEQQPIQEIHNNPIKKWSKPVFKSDNAQKSSLALLKNKLDDTDSNNRFAQITFSKKQEKQLKESLNSIKNTKVVEDPNNGLKDTLIDKYYPSSKYKRKPLPVEMATKNQSDDQHSKQRIQNKQEQASRSPQKSSSNHSDKDQQQIQPYPTSNFNYIQKISSRQDFLASNNMPSSRIPSNYQENNSQHYISYRDEDYQEREEQEIKPEQNRGVFLTMQESQSMVAQDHPKAYGFQIPVNKNVDATSLQQLKQMKILDMQRKRQKRIEQFRRNQSQKKVEIPKGRSSIRKKTQKQQHNQSQMPPKSATVDRKKPPRIQKDGVLVPFDVFPSQHNNRPSSSKQYSNHSNYSQQQPKPPVQQYSYNPSNVKNQSVKQQKNLSPYRNSKVLQSQNRQASKGRQTNIFNHENESQRQKSGHKITEPKIEPKDRKNAFSRQSNKKLMMNAITHVIFPGELNRRERQKLLQILEESQHQFFIFLFKEYSRKMIKGIYTLDSSQVRLQKIYGEKAPAQITADKVSQFYRFDSGSRQFKKVDGCKSFSLAIHAIDLR